MISNIKFFIDLPKNLSLVSPPLAVELLKQAKMAQSMSKGFFMRVGIPTLPIWGTPLTVGMYILFEKKKINDDETKRMATLGFLSLVIFSGTAFYTNRRKVAILEKLITDLTKIANQPS